MTWLVKEPAFCRTKSFWASRFSQWCWWSF